MYNAAHYLTADAYALAVQAMNYAQAAVNSGYLPAIKREETARRMCDAYLNLSRGGNDKETRKPGQATKTK